jgi:hypothetical protein
LKAEYFDAARSWKANVVRFAVHPSAWRSSGAGDYLRLLDQGVRFATERSLYVIIDWHSIGNLAREKFYRNHFGDQSTYQTTKQETFAFWRTMARHYGTNTTVACFELFNEPTLDHGQLGDCSWAEWKTMMEELIAEIRANGGQAIPLVAGFNWAYDLRPVAKHPINATNLAYVSHPYPMKVSPPWEKKWTRDWGFVAEKYPVILTEMGFTPPGEPGSYDPITGDENYGAAITQYCANRGISYTAWCFDAQWTPPLLKDWNYTPSRHGEFFKSAMQKPISEKKAKP